MRLLAGGPLVVQALQEGRVSLDKKTLATDERISPASVGDFLYPVDTPSVSNFAKFFKNFIKMVKFAQKRNFCTQN